MKKKAPALTLICILFCLSTNCASSPNIQTFYVDDGIQQYFVHPSKMSGAGCSALIDFTYRSSNDFVICNYTLSAAKGISRATSNIHFILDDGIIIRLSDSEIISASKNSKEIRLSSRISIPDFFKLISSKKTSLRFMMDTTDYSVQGGKYFYRQMSAAKLEFSSD